MYLVTFDNNEVASSPIKLSLLTHKKDELADGSVLNFFNMASSQSDDFLIELVLFDELAQFGQSQTALFTADNSLDELEVFVNTHQGYDVVFFVADFKDGRTFSLVRHLKNMGFNGRIFVLGNYGLDQAGYYHKSGATGFFVQDGQLDTITKTLNDLKTGHFGNSVNKLPMFQ